MSDKQPTRTDQLLELAEVLVVYALVCLIIIGLLATLFDFHRIGFTLAIGSGVLWVGMDTIKTKVLADTERQ